MASSGKKGKKRGPNIPPLVTDCIKILEEKGLKEEGILRVSGSALQIADLMKQYEKGKPVDISRTQIHTVAGLLKRYFKDSEESLLTFDLYEDFLGTAGIEDVEKRVEEIRELIEELPLANQEILHKLIVFLVHVSEFAEENNMHRGNLSTMFGPQLLRKPNQDPSAMMQDMQSVFLVIHTMIENHREIFIDWPDDQDHKPGTENEAPVDASKSEIKARKKIVEKALETWWGKTWKRDSARIRRSLSNSAGTSKHGGRGGIIVPTDKPQAASSTSSPELTGTIELEKETQDQDEDPSTSSSSSSSSSTSSPPKEIPKENSNDDGVGDGDDDDDDDDDNNDNDDGPGSGKQSQSSSESSSEEENSNINNDDNNSEEENKEGDSSGSQSDNETDGSEDNSSSPVQQDNNNDESKDNSVDGTSSSSD